MNPENEAITLSGQDALQILAEIDLVLISLHKIASYYYRDGFEISPEGRANYEKATTAFIDDHQVTQRLATARALLSAGFDGTLGEDNMDDLERACENIQYWTIPDDKS